MLHFLKERRGYFLQKKKCRKDKLGTNENGKLQCVWASLSIPCFIQI